MPSTAVNHRLLQQSLTALCLGIIAVTFVTKVFTPKTYAVTEKIYWFNSGDGTVYRANFDGTSEELISTGYYTYFGVYVDDVNAKIYAADVSGNVIVMNLDGSSPTTLIATLGYAVTDIAVDDANSKIYVTYDGYAGVYKADLDGSNGETLFGSDFIFPWGVAVSSGKLYLADPYTFRVMSADTDGTNLTDIVPASTYGPCDIDIDSGTNTVYWTDCFSTSFIYSADATATGGAGSATNLGVLAWGLSLDLTNSKIYYADGSNVYSADLDGSNAAALSLSNINAPTGAAIPMGGGGGATECNDGIDNDGDGNTDYPADTGCASAGGTTESPQCSDGLDNDSDGFTDDEDPGCYDNGNTVTGTYSASDNGESHTPACHNGVIENSEVCDDGNTSNTDACVGSCVAAACQDGYVRSGIEECDDGNATNTDACTNSCTDAVCGDSIVYSGVEDCDDGNNYNYDTCTNACVTYVCSDAKLNSGSVDPDGRGPFNGAAGTLRVATGSTTDFDITFTLVENVSDNTVPESVNARIDVEGLTLQGVPTISSNVSQTAATCSQTNSTQGICQGLEGLETLGTQIIVTQKANFNSVSATCGQVLTLTGTLLDNTGPGTIAAMKLTFNPCTCTDAAPACSNSSDDDSDGFTDDEDPGCYDNGNVVTGSYDANDDDETHTAACMNGAVEDDEECDDGNSTNTDACTNSCTDAVCGDGIVRSGVEECDDGNSTNTDTCTNSCTEAVCGDGYVQPGESCDDGNNVNDDACTNSCALATCGDSIVQSGEECDDGNSSNTDSCTNQCTSAACHDGYVQSGEDCDDHNTSNADSCVGSCVWAACGDGYVRASVLTSDHPEYLSTSENAAEECDPALSTTCTAFCTEQTGVGTSGGTAGSSAASSASSKPASPFCGNTVVDHKDEECDEGALFNVFSATCNSSCKKEYCGNGNVRYPFEFCEIAFDAEGNFEEPPMCGWTCVLPTCSNGDSAMTDKEKAEAGMCTGGCVYQYENSCSIPPSPPTEPSQLELTKIFTGFAEGDKAKPGELVSFTVLAANKGDEPMNYVTVEDVLPEGLVLESANDISGNGMECQVKNDIDFTFGGAPAVVECTIAQLNPGQNGIVTVKVKVAKEETCTDTISNAASGWYYSNEELVTAEATLSVDCGNESNLTVLKTRTSAPNADPGDEVTFNITVTTSSIQPMKNVKITDTLPEGLTIENDGVTQDEDGECTIEDSTITCTKSELDNDTTWQISITANVSDDEEEGICSQVGNADQQFVELSNTAMGSADGYNEVESNPATVNIACKKANLDVIAVANAQNAQTGDSVTYTFTLTNNSYSTAKNVKFRSQMPGFEKLEVLNEDTVNCDVSPDIPTYVVCTTLSELEPEEEVSFDVRADVDASDETCPFTVSGYATAEADGISEIESNEVDVDVACPKEPEPVVTLKKEIVLNTAKKYMQGSLVTYALILKNDGEAPANNVKIVDILPDAVEYDDFEATTVFAKNAYCNADGQTVTCRPSAAGQVLESGDMISLLLYSYISDEDDSVCDTQISNTATVTYDVGTTPASPITSDEATVTVDCLSSEQPDLTIEKTPSSDVVQPGDELTYTFSITNNTDATIGESGVGLVWGSDDLDESKFTFVKKGTACSMDSVDELKVTCNFDTIAPNAKSTANAYITVKVKDKDEVCSEGSSTMKNTLDVRLGQNGESIGSAESEVSLACGSDDLTIYKTVSGPITVPGGLVKYTITVKNNLDEPDGSDSSANDRTAFVVDDLDESMYDFKGYASPQGNIDCYLANPNTLLFECDMGTLKPQDSKEVVIALAVKNEDSVCTAKNVPIVNVAKLKEEKDGPVVETDSVTTSLACSNYLPVNITKEVTSDSFPTVEQGDTVQFAIEVENTGNDLIVGPITVDDSPDEGMTVVSMTSPDGSCDVFDQSCEFSTVPKGQTITIVVQAVITTDPTTCSDVTEYTLSNSAAVSVPNHTPVNSEDAQITVDCNNGPNFNFWVTAQRSLPILEDLVAWKNALKVPDSENKPFWQWLIEKPFTKDAKTPVLAPPGN